ncbi:MAG: HEAT repeat domain-containing protein [Planctomycetota bacterium]|nr:HEAT repeat domain-containing protein [Planctomycetota bacterium]
MSIRVNKEMAVGTLVFGLLALVSCQGDVGGPGSAQPEPEMVGSGDPTAEPSLPTPEPAKLRTSRLLRLEQALDNWYIAAERQEYGRKESLEQLLLEYTSSNLDAIISDLKHGSPRYRRVMAAALGFSGNASVVDPLMDALTDPYYEVVQHALLSLYHLPRPAPKPMNRGGGGGRAGRLVNQKLVVRKPISTSLIDAEKVATYLQHHRPEVRCNAALALRPLLSPESTPNSVLLALINASEDHDDRTRVHALAALAATRASEAIPHLVKALSDRLPLVRIRASLGLARVGDAQTAPYLIDLLEREAETAEVKRFVARALGVLLNVSGEAGLVTDPEPWRKRAQEAGILQGG